MARVLDIVCIEKSVSVGTSYYYFKFICDLQEFAK